MIYQILYDIIFYCNLEFYANLQSWCFFMVVLGIDPGYAIVGYGIVEYNGEQVGVYKDCSGKVFIVSTKCSHLGCQLHWNADELTWDCPCHGSRFTYEGRRLESPAIKNIQ